MLLRHREPGRLRAYPGAGAILLSCALFLGGFAYLTVVARHMVLFCGMRGLACWWRFASPSPSTTQFEPKTLSRLPCRLPSNRSPVVIAVTLPIPEVP